VPVRVEGRCDAAHEKARIVPDRERGAVERDDTVGDQRLQTRRGFQQGFRPSSLRLHFRIRGIADMPELVPARPGRE
jgi:hypothetical protein